MELRCGRQNIVLSPNDRYILVSGTYNTYFTWSKGFTEVRKLGILRWGDYPSLSQWAQCNYNDIYKREVRGSESDRMCPGNKYWSHAGSPTKECVQLLETGKCKETNIFSPQASKKNAVLLTHLELPGLHNCYTINLCSLRH